MKPKRLYNIIFPIWILFLFPQFWFLAIPLNYGIDLLVTGFSLKKQQITPRKPILKKVILRVWIAGFLADGIGGLLLFSVNFLPVSSTTAFGRFWYDRFIYGVMMDPFSSFFALAWVLLCTAVSGWFIYLFNSRWSFETSGLSKEVIRKTAKMLAVCTAPYLFLLPTVWFV